MSREYSVFPIAAMGKPRMTRADRITMAKLRGRRRLNEREQKRAPLLSRWLAYSDEVKLRGVHLDMDHFYHVVFVIPMPPSWSLAKRTAHCWMRHQAKPDKDNLEKGILDILFGDDSAAWDGRVTKVWGEDPFIFISTLNMAVNRHGIEMLIEGSA